MTTIGRILVMTVVAGVCALVHALIIGSVDLSEKTDEWGIELSATEQMQSILWVDARVRPAYEENHYPGAIHLSEDDWDAGLGQMLLEWDPNVPVVVYCDGQYCANSREIAARLRNELDVSEIYWLVGGWDVLKEVLPR